MVKVLISFPSASMVLSAEEFQEAVDDSHAVVREAKAAGVWVFGGGLDESIEPVTVGVDGTVTPGASIQLDGGFTVLDVTDRDEALAWAARVAAGCHCPQELRMFMFDPES